MEETVKRNTLALEESTEKLDFTRFGSFLLEYSEVAYIYTAVPTFLLALIGLLTGILLFVHKSQYELCRSSNDMLFGFILGQMIFYYTFALIYSNLLFQLIPYLYSLTGTFILFLCYFISNTGWALWGIQVLTLTSCENSVYYGIGTFTIAFTLAFDMVLLIAVIIISCKKKTAEIVPKPELKPGEKSYENKSSVDDPQIPKVLSGENQWNEEDLEGF